MSVTGDEASANGRLAGPGASRLWSGLLAGAAIGVVGGLVGLGGAEFRLPVLMVLGFAVLSAVIVNKAMSLVVILVALPSRLGAVPLDAVAGHWSVAASLPLGSLPGAWVGAAWATRMSAEALRRCLGGLLFAIAVLFAAHHVGELPQLDLTTAAQVTAGAVGRFRLWSGGSPSRCGRRRAVPPQSSRCCSRWTSSWPAV